MPNPFSDDGVSDEDVARAIAESAAVDAGLKKKCEEIRDYWRSVSPVHSGKYAASVKVLKAKRGKGKVGSNSPIAEEIEFGTGPPVKHNKRKQGGSSPAFAPGEKTAHHYGGTLDKKDISTKVTE